MNWHSSLTAILKEIPGKEGERFFYPIRNGSMRVGIYAPRGEDTQSPHEQDEIYIIHTGTGEFEKERQTISFAPGDVLFVKAKERHRFKNFSDDFQTWVIFWGPKGGEG